MLIDLYFTNGEDIRKTVQSLNNSRIKEEDLHKIKERVYEEILQCSKRSLKDPETYSDLNYKMAHALYKIYNIRPDAEFTSTEKMEQRLYARGFSWASYSSTPPEPGTSTTPTTLGTSFKKLLKLFLIYFAFVLLFILQISLALTPTLIATLSPTPTPCTNEQQFKCFTNEMQEVIQIREDAKDKIGEKDKIVKKEPSLKDYSDLKPVKML
jgi:hypothetical protein